MRRIAAVLLLLAAACGAPQEPSARRLPPDAIRVRQKTIRDDSERGNLLNIALGASVVSRTAEITLEQSAVRAIDGDPFTTWASPPDDGAHQVLLYALPARTRVERIGIQTPNAPIYHLASAQIDTSLDGSQFTPLLLVRPSDRTPDVQFFSIPPRDVVYLRLTTLEAPGKFAQINSLQVRGRWQEPPKQPPIAGCWSLNNMTTEFKDDRGRITGTIAYDRPLSLEGGSDGLVYRFVWVSGPNRGFAAIDITPDGKHLSGLRWFEEPIEYSAADSWFADRHPCGAAAPHEDVVTEFLRMKQRLPLYSLRFDENGALMENESAGGLDLLANFAQHPPSQRLRLVSREYRRPGAEQNRRTAQARLESLRSALQKRGIDARRFEWATLGSDNPPRPIETEIERTLYSTIELEAR